MKAGGKSRGGVRMGRGSVVEKGAVVGALTGRRIADKSLSIGPGARIRSGTVVYQGSHIGARFETGHYAIIREENRIGDDVQVWGHSIIDYGCTIGRRVHIHSHVYVSQYTVIKDGAFIAPRAVLLNDPHPGCPLSRQCMRGPVIGRDAIIGGGAVVLPMVKVGDGALVGAGAVVTRDVPAGAVVFGNPARVHGRKRGLKCWTGHVKEPYPKWL